MHPEIKKFWEDSGYEITSINYSSFPELEGRLFYHAKKINKWQLVARYFIVNNKFEIFYYLKGGSDKKYSEKEMFRLIKLKPFF